MNWYLILFHVDTPPPFLGNVSNICIINSIISPFKKITWKLYCILGLKRIYEEFKSIYCNPVWRHLRIFVECNESCQYSLSIFYVYCENWVSDSRIEFAIPCTVAVMKFTGRKQPKLYLFQLNEKCLRLFIRTSSSRKPNRFFFPSMLSHFLSRFQQRVTWVVCREAVDGMRCDYWPGCSTFNIVREFPWLR